MIYQVALPVPSADTYDYSFDGPLTSGCRVEVSFGNRKLIGLIISHSLTSSYELTKIKPITRVIEQQPVLSAHLLEFIRRSARYYHHPLGDAIRTALPKQLRQDNALASTDVTIWSVVDSDDSEQQLKRAPKQLQCLQLLEHHSQGMSSAQINAHIDNAGASLKGLLAKGLVKQCTAPYSETIKTAERSTPPTLNDEQAAAVSSLLQAQGFTPAVLHGVTGSGKTEVYLALIEQQLNVGKQCLVIVPEISLTPQLLDRFKSRFGVGVVALHSGLNNTERFQAWRQAQEGVASIIIGTRSAVFVPLQSPGLIIVDEEHDGSLKQQTGFRYHARDMAVMRAQMLEITIVLGSATPSLETMRQVELGNYKTHTLTQRAGSAQKPDFHIIDIRSSKLVEGFSALLVSEIDKTLKRGEQVLLFINRRGYAPAMLCHDCGEVIGCPRCSANMTWHANKNTLRCHYCGHARPAPRHCPECDSKALITAGIGTQQIEQSAKTLFPAASVLRIDRDTMGKKGSLEKALETVARQQVQVIVGTQLLAKGHDFPGITLVALMDVDQGFYSTDFRAAEKMSQQTLQVGGRAGRGKNPGQVFIQTHQPEHPLLHQLIAQNYSQLAQLMLDERQDIDFPPYAYLALIRSSAVKEVHAREFLQQASDVFQQFQSGVMIMGPVTAPMEKRAGRYRYQLLLQSPSRKKLHNLLTGAIVDIEKLKSARRTRWSVDIDPVELN